MKILLTNDDGYGSAGLETLYKELASFNEVTVVAPLANRSGYSSRITMNKAMELISYGNNRYALDGSPVDCVIAAFKSDILKGSIDLVISGINHGYNLGTDIVYSGTCAAARQAGINGTAALALSVEGNSFLPMASFVSKNLELLKNLCGKKSLSWSDELDYFVNINAPDKDFYKGVLFTSLCYRNYNDNVISKKEADRTFFSIVGEKAIDSYGDLQSDFSAVEKGYISLSLVSPGPGSFKAPSLCEGNFIF